MKGDTTSPLPVRFVPASQAACYWRKIVRHYTVKLGVTIPVRPYVGINGRLWPTIEEVQELTLPLWESIEETHRTRCEKFREALRLLREAGLHEQAEALQGPKWVEPTLMVEPRPATGNYTVDPFVGWRVRTQG